MNARQDDTQFRKHCHWYNGAADARRRTDGEYRRWPTLLLLVACLFALVLRAEAATCEWNADCITWKPPTTYTDNTPLDATQIASYKLETATAAAGPWTLLATINAPTTAYKSQPVSGTKYYRVSVTLKSGKTGAPFMGAPTTTVEPLPGPVLELQVVDNRAYRLDIGYSNQLRVSLIGKIPVGTLCKDQAVVAWSPAEEITVALNVVAYRQFAVIDSGKSRPLAVLANCERRS